MSNEAVGELRIDVTVQLAKMQAQFDDMQRRVNALNRKVNSEFRSMAKGIQTAMATVGVSLSVGALIAYGKAVVALGGQINDLSNTAGVNSTAFQALALHFMDSGVSMEELSKAFVKLRASTQEAVEGNEAMRSTFKSLGIDPARLQTLALERQLEVLAIAIVNAKDQNKAFNDVLSVLGTKLAPKLLTALKELGVDGFDKIAESTKKWQLTPEQLKTLDDAGDKLERMWMYVKLISAKGLVAADNFLSQTQTGPRRGTSMGREDMLTPNDFTGGMFKPGFVGVGGPGADAVKAAQDKAQAAEKERIRLAAEQAAKLKAVSDERKFMPRTDRSIDIVMSEADMEKVRVKIAETIAAQDKSLKELADSYRDMIDPTREFKKQMQEVNDLQMAGVMTAGEATDAITRLKDAMAKDQSRRVEQSLNEFFGPLDEKQKEINTNSKKTKELAIDVGSAFASSFEEAILSGKKFSVVLRGLGQDLLQIMLRRMITIPIANALVGMLPGFAEGGEPPVGKASIVGEEGPELFIPKTAGTIVPNHAFGSGGGRGNTYVIDARGADVGVVDRIAQALKALAGPGVVEKRALSAVSNHMRRGGSFA